MHAVAPSIPTIGEIARRLSVPSHRVEYIIRARGIHPCGWAGNARVFSEQDVDRIADELSRIQGVRPAPRAAVATPA
jgi:DNA-binding transcriptional MerR regulator